MHVTEPLFRAVDNFKKAASAVSRLAASSEWWGELRASPLAGACGRIPPSAVHSGARGRSAPSAWPASLPGQSCIVSRAIVGECGLRAQMASSPCCYERVCAVQ